MSQDEHDACWNLIPAYQADELSAEDRARFEAHAQDCAECAVQLEEIVPVEVAPEPERTFRDRVLRSLAIRQRHPQAFLGFLAAAVTVFLGIVGYVIVAIDAPPGTSADEVMDEGVALIMTAPSAGAGYRQARSSPTYERSVPLADTFARPSDEPAIFSPEAKMSDHNESADNEDYHQMKGDSKDFLSYIRGEAGGFRGRATLSAQGVYDTMGVGAGGGGGGRYGGAFGGRIAARVASANPTQEQPTPKGATASPPGKSLVPAAPSQDEAPRMSRKLIRSGEMEFEIDSFDGAVGTLTKVAIEEQGFIATVNSEKLQNGKVRGVVVVRVPPEHLDTLLLKLRALGDLKSQHIGSEDVTKTYLDLESRLRAARTMEERLLAIIKDGKGAIKDLLQAEKELGEWRTKIETMVGEINYYNNLIAHSTLTITLYEREIRAPFGLLETERVDIGLEVEDVEKAYTEALAAIAEAKGRIGKSELKQHDQGQFNATIQFEVAPSRAGALRDRFKQLGVMARLDINRSQEPQGGSGRPQDAKVQQNDTQVSLSLYNLVTVAPRETVQLNLASADVEKSYKAILDRVEKAGGRVLSSTLNRQKGDLSIGHLHFQIKSADADGVLQDVRAAGEVLKLNVDEVQDAANSTRAKRGFSVNLLGLGTVLPRETSTIVLASKDVAAGYRQLVAAARAADARVQSASLSENDRKNMTANLSLEIRREADGSIAEAMAKAGDVYTRNSTRSQDTDNVTDSKTLIHFRLFDASNIPARESVKLSVEVGDVEAVVKAVEAEYKGRLVDAKHTRDAGGRRESTMTIDLPLRDATGAIERLKNLGTVLEHVSAKNAGVPDNDLALARLELKVSNDVLVGRDSGPVASLKRGLAISVQAASWALMLVMIGVCFVAPLLLLVWTVLRLRKRFAAKPAPTPTPAA
jgi:hypothetical protein